MTPIVDPRGGDLEDDASSTKRRSLVALAGSLLAEISFARLAVVWLLLIGLPALLLGAAPFLASIWLDIVLSKSRILFADVWPVLALPVLAALGWLGGRRLLRLAETSFWSLNALAVQPIYILFREGLLHLAERLVLTRLGRARRAAVRGVAAVVAGATICGLGIALVALMWPASRWTGSLTDLVAPMRLLPVLLANGIVLVSAYFAVAGLVWSLADATMDQPRTLESFAVAPVGGRTWRIAHLSDLHVVGERYGFRVESGREGPCGNERFRQVLTRLDELHATHRLDAILMTGDLTDAGRSAEWVELFACLASFPRLARLVVGLPGNHDVNVVDRANPARLELPGSPTQRLRQIRTLSALDMLHGTRLRVVDRKAGSLGGALNDALAPHALDMAAFADTGSSRLSGSLSRLWTEVFPMVLPPDPEDGLGIIVLNSSAETHFSFTNALGLVSTEQMRGLEIAVRQYPRAGWIVALHHHVVEYPRPAKALSERIGTALVNGSWFVRRLRRLSDRMAIMHGHRHIDWIGACGNLLIVSAPSPVMQATDMDEAHFYVHSFTIDDAGSLVLLAPERITLPGLPAIQERTVEQTKSREA
ncbi:MAG: metallophosphoesterase [Reyranellaceae bacterium]